MKSVINYTGTSQTAFLHLHSSTDKKNFFFLSQSFKLFDSVHLFFSPLQFQVSLPRLPLSPARLSNISPFLIPPIFPQNHFTPPPRARSIYSSPSSPLPQIGGRFSSLPHIHPNSQSSCNSARLSAYDLRLNPLSSN